MHAEKGLVFYECDQCAAERKLRRRVANGPADPLWSQFTTATAIFPNNDIKYETNKIRAQKHAATSKEPITWVYAKGVPTDNMLRERPSASAEKRKWLTYHDRDCGALYGMVPLIRGMPMALTDHVDRNPKVQLLRGRIGYVKSWVEEDDEEVTYHEGHRILRKLPKVVFLEFPGAKWRIPGVIEDGVYPIVPCTRQWFLDKNRQKPILEVRRKQLPLAPAFAITAHASQGQTLSQGAIVDLQLG